LEKTFDKICPEKNTGLVQCWTVIRKRNSQRGHSGYQGGSWKFITMILKEIIDPVLVDNLRDNRSWNYQFIAQALHENHLFFKVFEMTGMDDFFILLSSKNRNQRFSTSDNLIKTRTGGSLQIQITANIGLVLENPQGHSLDVEFLTVVTLLMSRYVFMDDSQMISSTVAVWKFDYHPKSF